MNPIDAPSKPPNAMSPSPAIVIPPLSVQEALAPATTLAVWERVRRMPAGYWRGLQRCREDKHGVPELSAAAALAGRIPHAVIAGEVEHALEYGTRSTTALACMLLASIALECHDGGDDALALAQAALHLAAQPGQANGSCVLVMHAALVMARTGGLSRAASTLEQLRKDVTLPLAAHVHWASTAFAAGLPLAELLHDLQKLERNQPARQLHANAQAELSLRLGLVKALSCPASTSTVQKPASQGVPGKEPGSAYWVTRLQASWYAGDIDNALAASRRAAGLIGPCTPVADVLCYHLFSVLALGRSHAPSDASALDMHCFALHRLACAWPASAAAFAELASAVRDRCGGKTLAALHGVERVCDVAARRGQQWLAALASEEAALAASNAGLDSAATHYRQQALASYKRWGGLGRVEMLIREWGNMSHAPAQETCAENERVRRIQAGEIGLSIAHEVNQPLAAIALHSSAARKWLRRPEPNVERALASLGLISEAGRHAGEIVRGIQRLASDQENEIGCVAVDQTISDTLRSLHRPLRKHGIELELALNLGQAVIHANRAQFQQVVTNLVVNAIEALSATERSLGPRRIRVESRLAQVEEVEIIVEDNGPGIAPVNRDRMFRRLFTTKPDNTGLGLPISLAIVRAHHGHIDFEPREPRGACFRVRFPVRGPQSWAVAGE
ncbi:sensor histidine kinase [Massilia niabensis]|uniref:histidine kinase n=1 Tax=Massilia niabensis TaxID=544910 RepID=A0ABW0L5N3_9BURK